MQGIDLGSIFARILIDASGMTAGIQQVKQQLASLQGVGPSTINNISNATKNVSVEMNNLSGSVKNVTVSIKEAGESVRNKSMEQLYALRTIGGTAREVGGMMTRMGDRGVAAITGLVKAGADLNQTLLMVRNNTVMTDAEFADMTEQTKKLGIETGASMQQIAMGARHIRDYGFTGKNAMEQLTVATKAAVATQTDAGETAQLLSRVMRIFSMDESKAAGAMNALWFAAANSNLMMKDLVNTSGRAFAMAGPMGIRFEEVAAAISVFAHQGLNGSQAATQLINDMKKLHAPTKQTADYLAFLATKAGPDLRAAFTTAGLQANQISGSFQLIAEKARAAGIPLAEMLTHLFPGLRGETGALIGTSGQGLAGMKDSLGKIADMMEGRLDPLTQRYNDTQKQLGIAVARLNNAYEVMASTIAKLLTPAIINMIGYIKSVVEWFAKLPPIVQEGVLGFVALGAITLTVGGRMLTLVGTIYQIRAAMLAMTAANEAGAASLATTSSVLVGVISKLTLVGAGIYAGIKAVDYLKSRADEQDRKQAEGVNRLFPSTAANMRESVKGFRQFAINPSYSESVKKTLSAINAEQMRNDISMGFPGARRETLTRDAEAIIRDEERRLKTASPSGKSGLVTGNPVDPFKEWMEAQKKHSKGANEALRAAKQHAAAMKDLRLDMAKLDSPTAYSFAKALEEFYVGKKRGLPLDQITKRLQEQAEAAVNKAEDIARKLEMKRRAKRDSNASEFMSRVTATAKENLSTPELWDEAEMKRRAKRYQDEKEFMQRVKELAKENLATPDLWEEAEKKRRERRYADEKEFMNRVNALAKENLSTPELWDEAERKRRAKRDADEKEFMQRVLSTARDNQSNRAEQDKAKKTVSIWADAARSIKRDFANIFTNMFEDLFSGHKNFLQTFFNAFKQMLIKMAAELAASAVMRGLGDLFGGGKGKSKGGSTSSTIASLASFIPGGNVVAAGIGAIGSMLGFAEGGWVPGPIGKPQLAVVHGGEFVNSRSMIEGGAGGGSNSITVNLHGVNVGSDYDVDRMIDRIAWSTKRRLAVNPGSG